MAARSLAYSSPPLALLSSRFGVVEGCAAAEGDARLQGAGDSRGCAPGAAPGTRNTGRLRGPGGGRCPPGKAWGRQKGDFPGTPPLPKLKSKPGVPALGAVAGAKLGHPGDPPESTHELIFRKERGTEGNFRSAEH